MHDDTQVEFCSSDPINKWSNVSKGKSIGIKSKWKGLVLTLFRVIQIWLNAVYLQKKNAQEI